MSTHTFFISAAHRVTASGEIETLHLSKGVNVIVGAKDAGKTGWLRTISYVLGDTDSPEDALGTTIAAKYESASVDLQLSDGRALSLERRWTERGAKHAIFINGESVPAKQFSERILSDIGIPVVRFPRGNPYSGAAWPELSWRMLFRHMYREERFWSDLADRQPEREQHACVLQFLGAADKVYGPEYAEEVRKGTELNRIAEIPIQDR